MERHDKRFKFVRPPAEGDQTRVRLALDKHHRHDERQQVQRAGQVQPAGGRHGIRKQRVL